MDQHFSSIMLLLQLALLLLVQGSFARLPLRPSAPLSTHTPSIGNTPTTTTTTTKELLRTKIKTLLMANANLHVLLDVHDAKPSTAPTHHRKSEEIRQAKQQLARHIINFLSVEEDKAEPVYSGTTESSSDCAKLLNTWMATCVFG